MGRRWAEIRIENGREPIDMMKTSSQFNGHKQRQTAAAVRQHGAHLADLSQRPLGLSRSSVMPRQPISATHCPAGPWERSLKRLYLHNVEGGDIGAAELDLLLQELGLLALQQTLVTDHCQQSRLGLLKPPVFINTTPEEPSFVSREREQKEEEEGMGLEA